jgi:hypothetical protein
MPKKSLFKFRWEITDDHRCYARRDRVVGITANGNKFSFCETCNYIVYWS